jgi:hypothetical protein
MIEQFLQTALEFIKEVWFQLDSRFDLENTEVLKFLKPYLIQLQDDPLYMGVSLAALFLVPYALIKVRSISKERERKLDELMEEMEDDEEYDEDDPRRLRRPDPEVDEDTAKPLFENDKDAPPSYMKVLDRMEGKDVDEEDFESELEEFELDSSSSDNEETINSEESAEPISSQLTESDFEKDLNEFMSDDIDMEKDVELHLDDSAHDQAIKELQEDGELMEFDGHLPSNDPFANYSELDEDGQDKAIKDLQDEMERTINQLTEQIEEPTEPPSSIKDLSHLRIGGDATIDDEYSPKEDEDEFFLEDPPSPETGSSDIENEAPALPEESTPISELSDSEILAALEPELKDTLDLESMLEPESEPEFEIEPELEAIPDTRDYEPELAGFTFEAESDISSEEPESEIDDFRLEPEVSAENFTFAAESMGFEEIPEPELRAERPPVTDEYASPGQTDSLIDRLKFLQTRFENRYQPVERSSSPISPVEKSIPNYTSENFVEPRRYSSTPAGLPPGSKKYMDLLESFIFMKDQRKHK